MQESQLPTLSELLDNQDCPQWLKTTWVEYSSSPSLFDRCCGVALVGRLWSNPNKTQIDIDQLINSKANPRARARIFAKSLSKDSLDEILSVARTRANALIDRCEHFFPHNTIQPKVCLTTNCLTTNGYFHNAHLTLVEILHERDDLECAFFLLKSSPLEYYMKLIVSIFDPQILHYVAATLRSAHLDDERLGQVFWQEPNAWWSTALE